MNSIHSSGKSVSKYTYPHDKDRIELSSPTLALMITLSMIQTFNLKLYYKKLN